MIDNYPKIWEEVTTTSNLTVLRLRVPGGYLVCVRDSLNDQTTNVVFVSNPEHSWQVTDASSV